MQWLDVLFRIFEKRQHPSDVEHQAFHHLPLYKIQRFSVIQRFLEQAGYRCACIVNDVDGARPSVWPSATIRSLSQSNRRDIGYKLYIRQKERLLKSRNSVRASFCHPCRARNRSGGAGYGSRESQEGLSLRPNLIQDRKACSDCACSYSNRCAFN